MESFLEGRTEACGLAATAPADVGPDEEGPPQATKDPQQDEGDELEQIPRRVILHVEQHQAAVAEGVDGAQYERRHQGGEEGAPERLEGEVVAHLAEGETGS